MAGSSSRTGGGSASAGCGGTGEVFDVEDLRFLRQPVLSGRSRPCR